MAGAAIEHAYRYAFASELRREGGRADLRLATSGVDTSESWFCKAGLTSPRRSANLMLAVGHVAATRFYTPPGMLQRILLAADPVVTSSRDRLRFESFSLCCGVYARLDLLESALIGQTPSRSGTTNVDFNPSMRAALAQMSDTDQATLTVGTDRVELERRGTKVVERKVPLPLRWLKGFVETQAYQSRMKLTMDVDGGEARRFLRSVPRKSSGSAPAWVTAAGKGLRLSFSEASDAVPIAGTERIRLLETLSRDARRLRLYTDGKAGAWELDFADARFVLVVSPEPSRGFSGEGQVLKELSRDSAADQVPRVQAALRWNSRIEPAAMAKELDFSPQTVTAALAVLGSRGLVGYDLAEGAYFHRELPFNLELVESIHPRLEAARKLVKDGAVTLGDRESHVRSKGVVHRVRRTPGAETCTCPWFAKYRGSRGPCKHVLAVQITEDADDAG